MKKFIFVAVIAISSAVLSTAVVCQTLNKYSISAIFMDSVEVLTRSEESDDVTCCCPRFFGGRCKASNSGSTCASGHNIHCGEYDGNC